MKILGFVGVLMLLHCVYSAIEFHKYSKDSIQAVHLPKDVGCI